MYKCSECDTIFEEDEIRHREDSPCCLANLEIVQECQSCLEYVCKEKQSFCQACQNEILEKFSNFLKTFDVSEKATTLHMWEDEKIDIQEILEKINNNINNDIDDNN